MKAFIKLSTLQNSNESLKLFQGTKQNHWQDPTPYTHKKVFLASDDFKVKIFESKQTQRKSQPYLFLIL